MLFMHGNMARLPTPSEGILLTHFIVSDDVEFGHLIKVGQATGLLDEVGHPPPTARRTALTARPQRILVRPNERW